MKTTFVTDLLQNWQTTKPNLYSIADRLYQCIKQQAPELIEKVKYGGILFYRTEAESSVICGVFVYQQHVSLEFSQGAQFEDVYQQLEGSGRFRRHLKFRNRNELDTKNLNYYLALAIHS
ncbi:DUF1801 domain-containing protein [Thiomicrorhabdus aquaedulcis]|uniref:DUF1801 domain-containing protein n=1 Tax=Thiomicrorhabdus aquaedulcis TaxID=2211106 RepID=UPI0018D58DCD|nr:DUF1801 domain-containing protein [Thiomicrorhabdus aquaedulcis]